MNARSAKPVPLYRHPLEFAAQRAGEWESERDRRFTGRIALGLSYLEGGLRTALSRDLSNGH